MVVGLEDDPLGSVFDGLLDHVEETTNVDVTPRWIARDRSGTPNSDATILETTNAVDALGVEDLLLTFGNGIFQT